MHRKWLGNRKFRTDNREELASHFANVVRELAVRPKAVLGVGDSSTKWETEACTTS
jgi:hypothetical protein